jgi:uncharacterized YigZ family protein
VYVIMEYTMPLYIPESASTYELEVRRSRFIANASELTNPKDAKKIQKDMRKEFPNCSHVVYGFIIGKKNSITMGMTDDGEPKGTSGNPVLDVLKGSGITNVIVTVVRFFGGIKLGKGGLVRAYSKAAKGALDNLKVTPLMEYQNFTIKIDYQSFQQVSIIVEEAGGEIIESFFGTSVDLTIKLPKEKIKYIDKVLLNLSSGTLSLIEKDKQNDSNRA